MFIAGHSARRRCLIRSRTDGPATQEHFISTVLRLLVAAYFIEAGILLIFAPWTALWDRNFFAETQPWLHAVMANSFVRGGVTGVGVITVVAGLRDLTAAILRRPAASAEPSDASPPTP